MWSPNNQRTVLNITADKLDYLKYLLSSICIDIVCITETWFKPELDDSNFAILNDSCTRLERRNGLRRGVIAFYCKKGLKIAAKLESYTNSDIEYLGIELRGLG